MAEVINTTLTEDGTLEIYLGNRLLATIEDGNTDEDFIEDVLYSMGYKWNQDGTVTKINKTN
jgi:hypothetical protein